MVSALAGRSDETPLKKVLLFWRDVFELEAPAVVRLSFQLGFIYCSTSATARCLTLREEKGGKKSHNTVLSPDTKGTQLQQWAVIKALQQQCKDASLSSLFLQSRFASLFITSWLLLLHFLLLLPDYKPSV